MFLIDSVSFFVQLGTEVISSSSSWWTKDVICGKGSVMTVVTCWIACNNTHKFTWRKIFRIVRVGFLSFSFVKKISSGACYLKWWDWNKLEASTESNDMTNKRCVSLQVGHYDDGGRLGRDLYRLKIYAAPEKSFTLLNIWLFIIFHSTICYLGTKGKYY